VSVRWILVCAAFAALGALTCPRSTSAQASSSSLAVPGSPTMEGDGYLYISAQGPRQPDGTVPREFAVQVRQSLDNIRKLVEAAGLTMDHVVYVQVYLEDVGHYAELNTAFAAYFSKDPPARSVLGVARVPESPLQINAIAVRDLKGKQPVSVSNWPASKGYSAGMLTHDRLFVSTMLGADPVSGAVPQNAAAQVDLALDRLSAVLQAAGLTNANMVFVNPYLTSDISMRVMNEHYARRFEFGNTPGRATIQVSSLPEGAHIAYTGVAVRDLSRRKSIRPKNMPPSPTASPCVFAGDTLYCSAKSGFIPGPNGGVYFASTADQTRQTMRNQLDNLEEAEMNFEQVVSATTYLDDISESPQYASVFSKYFKGKLPAQSTVQQIKPGDRKPNTEGQYPDLEQMSLIAIRNATRMEERPTH
jgi:enamine deaminase RidA (YjgF/YER057c/UK114 family)